MNRVYQHARVIIFAFSMKQCDLREDRVRFSGGRVGDYIDSKMSIQERPSFFGSCSTFIICTAILNDIVAQAQVTVAVTVTVISRIRVVVVIAVISGIRIAVAFTVMIMKPGGLAINSAARIDHYQGVVFTIAVRIVISNRCSIAQTEVIDVGKVKLDSGIEERAQSTTEESAHKYSCGMLNPLALIRKYRIINDPMGIEPKIQIVAICDGFFHGKCTKTELDLETFDILHGAERSVKFLLIPKHILHCGCLSCHSHWRLDQSYQGCAFVEPASKFSGLRLPLSSCNYS